MFGKTGWAQVLIVASVFGGVLANPTPREGTLISRNIAKKDGSVSEQLEEIEGNVGQFNTHPQRRTSSSTTLQAFWYRTSLATTDPNNKTDVFHPANAWRFVLGPIVSGTDPCTFNLIKAINKNDPNLFLNAPLGNDAPNNINGEWQIKVDDVYAKFQGIGTIGPDGDNAWLHFGGKAIKCVPDDRPLDTCTGKHQNKLTAKAISRCDL